MTLVDSSVWIDYFNGVGTRESDHLDAILGVEPVVTGDLIVAEVLQGFRRDRHFSQALRLMQSLEPIDIGGFDIAVQAARNFRTLRGLGVTVRKTIDCLIATRCIRSGHALLYSDRDFDPFVRHLALRPALRL
ncbi:MAG: putative nucleic acid-binding protein [Brevundimonas sp.]|jgi:predicted nucleic acid-binding protein|uniref:type II toxin-antitoxin system VapC family toxin n=1 Tax=Brevundimonas sp. TaxID=1871086 RepID=UPI0039E6025B